MSGLKKMFGAGGGADDEIMYGSGSPLSKKEGQQLHEESLRNLSSSKQTGDTATSGAVDEGDRRYDEPSGTTGAGYGGAAAAGGAAYEGERRYDDPKDTSDKSEEPKKGLLGKILPSKSEKDSKDDYSETKRTENPTTTQQTYSEPQQTQGLTRTEEFAGVGTAGAVGGAGALAYEERKQHPEDDDKDLDENGEPKKKGFLSKIFHGNKDEEEHIDRPMERYREGDYVPGTSAVAGGSTAAYEERKMKHGGDTTDDAADGEEHKKQGLFSKLRGSKSDREDPEENKYKPYEEAAAGTAVVGGGAGALAYEENKKKAKEENVKPKEESTKHTDKSEEPKKEGLFSKLLGHKSEKDEPAAQDTSKYKPYEEAAAGTAVVGGGAGALAYEENKKKARDDTAATSTDKSEEPKKEGFLSKLRGSKDKDEPTTQDSSKYKPYEEAAAGTAVVGGGAGALAYEERKKRADEEAKPTTTTTTTSTTQSEEPKKQGLLDKLRGSKDDKDSTDQTASSKYKPYEEAAAGTAVVGGVGGLAYEEEKKRKDEQAARDPTGNTGEPKQGGLWTRIMPSRGGQDSSATATEPTAHDSELGQGATVAGAGALGATGVGAASHESDPRTDTGSAAAGTTYTERSYPLASGEPSSTSTLPASSTSDSHFGRDAAIGGVGAGAVGTGIYAATRDHDRDTPTSANVTATQASQYTTSTASQPATSTTDSHLGRDAAIGGVGAGVVGGGAYAATRDYDRDHPTSSNVTATQATPSTVASPPQTVTSSQPTTSTGGSHLGRDAAIGGAGAGLLGAGAYAATRGNDQLSPDTSAKDIQNPEQVDSASRLAPHVPGEFPTEEGADVHGGSSTAIENPPPRTSSLGTTTQTSGVGSAAAVGGVAGGAGGIATSDYGSGNSRGLAQTSDRDNYYGSPPSTVHQTPSTTQATEPTSTTDDTHYGRDAALVGGVGTGAAGIAAYEAHQRHEPGAASKTVESSTDGAYPSDTTNVPTSHVKDSTPTTTTSEQRAYPSDTAGISSSTAKDSTPTTTSTEPQHDYERNGALAAATAAAGGATGYEATKDDNRVRTDSSGHSRLHKKSEETSGEKKPGFISKLLHRGDKSKKENDEPSSPSASTASPSRDVAGAGAADKIEQSQDPASSSGMASSSTQGYSSSGLPVGEDGMIHIIKEGAPSDAPAIIVKDDGSVKYSETGAP